MISEIVQPDRAFIARLQEIRLLQKGWDGEDALPVSPDAIKLAEKLIADLNPTRLADFQDPVVTPKYDGLLQLEWHDLARTLEFDLTPGGWSVMGVIGGGDAAAYHIGAAEVGESGLSRLKAAYVWWAERGSKWPFA